MEFNYDESTKNECWYLDICDKRQCEEFCQRHYRMDYLVQRACLVGKQRKTVSLYPEAIDRDAYVKLKGIKENINDFVANGKNVLIYSEKTGNGKTEWAKKLLLSWLNSIWSKSDFECRGLFIQLPKFIQAMKENISKPNDYFNYINDNINTADLVIWDEINYKDYSEFEMDYLLSVISNRMSVGKANVFTTNYSLPTIKSKLGSRLSSRIIGNSELIEFKGGDRRNCGGDK